MTIWLFALILTAIACATLYYAGAGRTVNAGRSLPDATNEHFRAQLKAIDTDAAMGRLGAAEATAAKGELAREIMRFKEAAGGAGSGRFTVWVPILLVAVLSLGTYYFIGRPDLPASPLATAAAPQGEIDLDTAIAQIEQQLAVTPDDLRGWQVIAPAYMQLGRYADAVRALRRVNELTAPTADSLTDLGEALMMQRDGNVEGEPMQLFRDAAALDARHIRSRFYIAGEDTRAGNFEAAIGEWNALIALAEGNEPWLVTARNGLAFAEQGLTAGTTGPEEITVPDDAAIDAMVDGLAARLTAEGGTVDEWTRLVRSRMVQGRMEDAQAAYTAARQAYPDASVRTELDVLAADNGLVAQ
ncbi:MAG: c-type cytochrome biogenesis protein CcmI [Hyphomicrobiales bacterium]|nr:MAG: c-type cytochrome biogenesis protein CcmI [Hyphomicrobiales bacterium]